MAQTRCVDERVCCGGATNSGLGWLHASAQAGSSCANMWMIACSCQASHLLPDIPSPCNPASYSLVCTPGPVVQVPITPDFVYSFGPQASYLYSALAGTFYAPVVTWAASASVPGEPYYAWDALTVACMMQPTLCEVGNEGTQPDVATS